MYVGHIQHVLLGSPCTLSYYTVFPPSSKGLLLSMITVWLKVELIAESFNKTHVKEEVNMSEHAGDRRVSDSHLLGALIGRGNRKMEMLKTVLNCVP